MKGQLRVTEAEYVTAMNLTEQASQLGDDAWQLVKYYRNKSCNLKRAKHALAFIRGDEDYYNANS